MTTFLPAGRSSFFAVGVDDALVGLVRDEPIDVRSSNSCLGKRRFDHVGDHADGMLEDLPPSIPQMPHRLRRGWSAIYI